MSAKFFALLLIFSCFSWSGPANATASLLAENTITDAVIEIKTPDGSTQSQVFTLVKDAAETKQWYYYPNQPRLAEQIIDGKRIPELSFIRYTYQEGGQVKANGLLTFAITISASPEAVMALKSFLEARLEARGDAASDVRLSPIPLNSARALVYSPKDGVLISDGDVNAIIGAGNNDAGTNSNSKIVFALKLTDVGADIYDALLNGTGGIPVFIDYKYNGLTPPAGFTVTANWDLAYEHYSKNTKFRARASYYGLFSANYESDKQYIRDELNKSGAIKINAITGGSFDQSVLDSYLQPIIKRLNDEMLEDQKPPDLIDPAKASKPNADGRFGGIGYSVSVKDVKQTRKGSETWDYSISSIIERSGRADGSVSLLGYPEEVRQKLVTSVRAGSWQKVYYALPAVPSSVDQATLHLRLVGNDKEIQNTFLKWSDQSGWQTNDDTSITGALEVSLLGVQDFSAENAVWITRFGLTVADDTVSTEVSDPLDGTNAGLYIPSELIRFVKVSSRGITYESEIEGVPNLFNIDVELDDGLRKKKFSFDKTSIQNNSETIWVLPSIRDNNETEVEAKVSFVFLDRDECSLSIGKEKFRELFKADKIFLKVLAYRECKIKL